METETTVVKRKILFALFIILLLSEIPQRRFQFRRAASLKVPAPSRAYGVVR
jgi:hypothetical protein